MSNKKYQLVCEVCGEPFEAKRLGSKYHTDACRVKAFRGEARVRGQLVLSLFPGADLLGRAFEATGFTVVRGPDVLWGGDVRTFHVPPGRFDGVIGGPPCQAFSKAAITGTEALNLIPEYLRIIEEAQPKWAVMENVVEALVEAPKWPYTILEDYDCGGTTGRTRGFWFYGIPPALEPAHRNGDRAITLLASMYNVPYSAISNRKGKPYITAAQAAEIQGYPGLADEIMAHQPFKMSASARRMLAIHMLGNGVPRAMGEYVAKHVKRQVMKRDDWERTDLPPYPLFLAAGR